MFRDPEPYTELSQAKIELIDALAEENGKVIGYGNLGDLVGGTTPATVCEHCETLEEMGLIELDPNPSGTFIGLTAEGWSYRQQVLPELPKATTDSGEGGGRPKFRPHYVTAVLDVRNSKELLDLHGDWRTKWVENRSQRWQHNVGNDSYVSVREGVLFRFHRETVTVMLKEPVVDTSVTRGMNRAMTKVWKAVRWVREETPCDVGPREVHISTSHIGDVRNFLAEYVKRRSDLSLSDFVVVDRESGRERLTMDESTGVWELEGKGPATAEEDIRFLGEEWVEHWIHEKEGARELMEFARFLERNDWRDLFDGVDEGGLIGERIDEKTREEYYERWREKFDEAEKRREEYVTRVRDSRKENE